MLKLCSHVKSDGTQCGSAAYSGRDLYYYHHRDAERARRRRKLGKTSAAYEAAGMELPALEDRASIQIAIDEVLHAIIAGRLDRRDAALLLRGLGLAIRNLHKESLTPTREKGEVELDGDTLAEMFLTRFANSRPARPGDPTYSEMLARRGSTGEAAPDPDLRFASHPS